MEIIWALVLNIFCVFLNISYNTICCFIGCVEHRKTPYPLYYVLVVVIEICFG
jgi:hypothetical protein